MARPNLKQVATVFIVDSVEPCRSGSFAPGGAQDDRPAPSFPPLDSFVSFNKTPAGCHPERSGTRAERRT